jgi:hypothetical protein
MTCNFQTGHSKIKLLTEYESVTEKVLFGSAVLSALMSGRNYDAIPQNVRTLVFRNRIPLSKRIVATELNMKKIHLQIILSDVG